jgi:Flp pilus assembly protein protease CpaA
MLYPSSALLLVAIALALAGAFCDWRFRVVPNWLTLPALVLGPVIHAWGGRALHPPGGMPGPLFGALLSLASACVCGLVPMALFALRLGGGGDAKLLAALGALVLPGTGLALEVLAFAFAAFFVPARLAYYGELTRTLGSTLAVVANPALPPPRRRQLPGAMTAELRLGPFILLATLAAPIFLRMTR